MMGQPVTINWLCCNEVQRYMYRKKFTDVHTKA